MKKELNIPKYKEVGSNVGKYSYLAAVLIITAFVFAGVSLPGLTGYNAYGSQLENFPVSRATSKNYAESPTLNRGSNAFTLISISPEKTINGGEIYVTIDPGNECVWKRVKLFYWGPDADSVKECGEGVMKDDNLKQFANERQDAVQSGVGFKICDTRTFRYTTSASLSEGTYAIAAYDYAITDWVCEPFIVYRMNSRSEDIRSFDPTKSILNQI